MNFLAQSTAVTVKLGPFIDNADFITPETGLTITRAQTKLSKNGGALTQKTQTSSATHDADGFYAVSLDATDTGTAGRLRLTINATGALPYWEDFWVGALPASGGWAVAGDLVPLQNTLNIIAGDTSPAGVRTITGYIKDALGAGIMDAQVWLTADTDPEAATGIDSGELVQHQWSADDGKYLFHVDDTYYWLHSRKDGAFDENSVRVASVA